jgi:hypothetical protein
VRSIDRGPALQHRLPGRKPHRLRLVGLRLEMTFQLFGTKKAKDLFHFFYCFFSYTFPIVRVILYIHTEKNRHLQ